MGAADSAASELGMRFHPTYGSMSLSVKDGGLPPDDAVLTEDEILANSKMHVERWHDPSHGSMIQIALAPCSPFSVTPELMRQTAELAEAPATGGTRALPRSVSTPAMRRRVLSLASCRRRRSVAAAQHYRLHQRPQPLAIVLHGFDCTHPAHRRPWSSLIRTAAVAEVARGQTSGSGSHQRSL